MLTGHTVSYKCSLSCTYGSPCQTINEVRGLVPQDLVCTKLDTSYVWLQSLPKKLADIPTNCVYRGLPFRVCKLSEYTKKYEASGRFNAHHVQTNVPLETMLQATLPGKQRYMIKVPWKASNSKACQVITDNLLTDFAIMYSNDYGLVKTDPNMVEWSKRASKSLDCTTHNTRGPSTIF